ncbi:hypothetical protein RJ640_000085 [Escallonia rubra]|uniref:Uncharacterized protein n=1 Tax=Escallonia rubra TaxID=112253 RepID=A0AA88U8F2_9ASTE|nr:hypothetical protein RJ640_000085 [Escallonia rubra]
MGGTQKKGNKERSWLILSAYNAGAKIVKVYPVSALGGSRYIATLKKPFPHIPLVASQGITLVKLHNKAHSLASEVGGQRSIYVIDGLWSCHTDTVGEFQGGSSGGDQRVPSREDRRKVPSPKASIRRRGVSLSLILSSKEFCLLSHGDAPGKLQGK